MIETLDNEVTTDPAADGAAEDQQAIADAEATAMGERRCLACESLIPPNAIRTKVLGSSEPGRPSRARRVHLYCGHCDLTYELVQVRSGDGWTNSAMTAVTDRATRAKVARDMAAGQGVTYVDRPDADATDQARQDLIDHLERYIASSEQMLAEARARRSQLMGVTPAGTSALGIGGWSGGSFPYTSGDMRHLMEPHDADEQSGGDHWSQQ